MPHETENQDVTTPRGDLRDRLLGLANPDGAWPWAPGGPSATEPTALAALALAVDEPGHEAHTRRACDVLVSTQRRDGSLGLGEGRGGPGWPTSLAILAWSASGTHPGPRARAVSWLLREKGKPEPKQVGQAIGHDTSLVGWSWTSETHPWVEPTALAILALRREGRGGHPRVRQGVDLLFDRAIASGGWNYGNRLVFDRPQRPQPAPTALALLAVAGTDGGRSPDRIEPALTWLQHSIVTLRAGASLGWSLLALRAWGRSNTTEGPETDRLEDALIHAAAQHALHRPDPASALALLLLAVNRSGPGVFLDRNVKPPGAQA
jgi:hypothetical protein